MEDIKFGWYVLHNDEEDFRIILARIDSPTAYCNMKIRYDNMIYLNNTNKDKILNILTINQ